MSTADKVTSLNPFLVLIWIFQLILFWIDWSADGVATWSVMIIGSFFIIQVYMIWKTNYDEMMEEQRDAQARAMGGPINDVPKLDPSKDNLNEFYKTSASDTSSQKSEKDMVNININSNNNAESEK